MNRLQYRTWQIVAVLVILTLIGSYLYLRFFGWGHPFAKLIGAYTHHVATLGDFVRYKGNPNRLYNDSAPVLSFDCEPIRDDFVKLTQSITSPELAISSETMVWREGRVLHLADPTVADDEAFAAWKNQVVDLATTQRPHEANHYGTLLQALFTSVTVNGSKRGEEFSVETIRSSKFDACE
jgi:hypothetical protein